MEVIGLTVFLLNILLSDNKNPYALFLMKIKTKMLKMF